MPRQSRNRSILQILILEGSLTAAGIVPSAGRTTSLIFDWAVVTSREYQMAADIEIAVAEAAGLP